MPSIFISTRDKSKSEQLPNDGRQLFLHFDSISSIGEEMGLARLDEYIYVPTDQMLEFLKGAGATDEEIENANPELWFDPKEGLELISNYINALNKYHTISQATLNAIVPELKEFKRIMEILEKENNEWHFEYDI